MDYFEGRLDDLAEGASRGEIMSSGFLTPQECVIASRHLRSRGAPFELFGGYDTAERRMAFILPEWCAMPEEKSVRAVIDAEMSARIVPLMLKRDEYVASHPGEVRRPIGHRDYLGALLGLGIDRSRVGDICVCDAGAAVFVMPQTAAFLMSDEKPLTQVGHEIISVAPFDVPEGFDGWRRYEQISGVGASGRVDSVLSALTNQSREKIKDAVRRGEAEKNYETVTKPDAVVTEGDILSLRGWGKCRITGFSDTRKDRVRVSADRYI